MKATAINTKHTYQDRLDILEVEYVDRIGIARTLEMLAEVCFAKADHISASWQDQTLASMWSRQAEALNKLSDALTKKFPRL